MPRYLTDSSIWIAAHNRRDTYLPELLAERLERDEIATCVPVALEVLTGPPSGAVLDREWDALWKNLHWIPVGLLLAANAYWLVRVRLGPLGRRPRQRRAPRAATLTQEALS